MCRNIPKQKGHIRLYEYVLEFYLLHIKIRKTFLFPAVFYEAETVQFLRMWRINNKGDEFTVPFGQTKNIGRISLNFQDLKKHL